MQKQTDGAGDGDKSGLRDTQHDVDEVVDVDVSSRVTECKVRSHSPTRHTSLDSTREGGHEVMIHERDVLAMGCNNLVPVLVGTDLDEWFCLEANLREWMIEGL